MSPNLRAQLGLCVIMGPVLLVSMDGSILFLAMPMIAAEFRPSADQALWILDIYTFVVGALLVTFGNIGDRYGRLRLMMAGVTVFGIGSVWAAVADTPVALIAARALMGVGGATLLPSSLAIIGDLFPDPKVRARAIGVFAATFAVGFAIGPIVGGAVLQSAGWHAVFLINLPVLLLFLTTAPFILHEVSARTESAIDLPSLALSVTGILATTYWIKSWAATGAGLATLVVGMVGIAALLVFLRRQRRIDAPLIDLHLFADRVFSIAILTGLLSIVCWSAIGYLSGIYLQSVLGLKVMTAGLLAVPAAVVLIAVSLLSPPIVEQIGRRRTLIATHVLIALGCLTLLIPGTAAYVAGTIIANLGFGLTASLVAEVAVSAVRPERAGAAGAIAETSNELGNSLGIALLGSLAAVVFRLYGPALAPTLSETLALAPTVTEIAAARHAFVLGKDLALGVAAVMMLALALLAVRWLPKER